MERDYKKELAVFEAVWRRVSGEAARTAEGTAEGIRLMPRREAKSAAVRYGKPRRS